MVFKKYEVKHHLLLVSTTAYYWNFVASKTIFAQGNCVWRKALMVKIECNNAICLYLRRVK